MAAKSISASRRPMPRTIVTFWLPRAETIPHIHPSEPNYIWVEAGTNFGVFNDNDPFAPASGTGQISNQDNQLHLVRLFDQCGVSWKSYQEDIDLVPDGTSFDNIVLPQNQWIVP